MTMTIIRSGVGSTLLAAAVLLLPGSALPVPRAMAAGAPRLVGTYALSLTSPCQARISTTKDAQGKVIAINTVHGGEIYEEIGTMTFSASTGLASLSAYRVYGSALIVVDNGGTNLTGPTAISRSNVPYSTTATTFTFDGGVNHAVYADIDPTTNIAHVVVFLAREGRCASHGTLTRRS